MIRPSINQTGASGCLMSRYAPKHSLAFEQAPADVASPVNHSSVQSHARDRGSHGQHELRLSATKLRRELS
jgi:hypothetical protein